MKNRFLSLLCVLALCLGLLPVTALAAEGAPNSLYVGNQQVISGNDITYWTTGTDGKLTASNESGNWNVKYDPSTVTLSLQNAKISGGNATTSPPYGAGIYALSSSGQPVALTIELIGENTITGTFGIYVNATPPTPPTTPGTDASLVIKKSGDNGSLTVTGTDSYGLYIASGTGNASLTIKNVSVVANATSSYSGSGVCVQSGASATDSPNISLSVDGGSLTASGTGSNDGILFYVGQSQATGATTSLTVSENAIVDARNGGIKALKISETLPTPTPTGNNSSGIVFDRTEGTVYGNVELQKDLEIKSGETLTVPEGSSLNCNGKLTNNGTILASGGTVSGQLKNGTTVTTPSITGQPQNKKVTAGEAAEFSVTASAGSETPTYQWQQSTDSGSNWTDISAATANSYTINSTTASMSGNQYRCVVKSASGVSVISSAATLTVTENTEPTTYTISTAEQLYAFANAVNTGNTTANAVLTADITLDSNSTVWTPIGKDDPHMYNGTFDGQGHTISGLHCSVTSGNVAGLFGEIGSSGVVKNVGIADSDVAVSTTGQVAYAGGVCGWNEGTIENCWNSGSVTATCNNNGAYAGGVCGWNQGTITNCWNSGSVSASASVSFAGFAGGVCGYNLGTIENCWNSGKVSSSDNSFYGGGVCGVATSTSTITNCYWLAGTAEYGIGNPQGNTAAESKTTDEFASGEVAWRLNQGQTGTPWGQGSNGMPVLEDNHPASVTSYVPVRITIVMTDSTEQYRYTTAGSTVAAYPTGYAFVFKDDDTKTWINKGTQTYDADATIYAENMTLEKIPAKAATCTEDGNSEYWYSEAYDKYFSDANGVNEITAESTVIPATKHELTKVAAKEPTSTQAGNIEYWVCSTCGKYFSDENGENEITAEDTVIPAIGHGSGGTPSKTPSQQAVDKIEDAKGGDIVEITLPTGKTTLDKEVFEELAGKDVTLEISVPGGVTWTVNGQDIPKNAKLSDLDLGVTLDASTIPVSVINTITGTVDTIQLSLKHDGAFGFTMTLTAPVGAKNAGLWANLYRYDEDAGKLAYQTAALVDENGNVALPFDHASQYALVLDSKSHELPFTDVPEDAWYYDGVQFAYVRGIMKGTGDATTFSPAMPLNRAMLMTMLARLAGVDTKGGATWYEKGLAWAVAAGVSDGTAPERDITRQELMTMLYRYVGSPAVSGDLSSYPDGAGVAAWAEDAMLWSVQAGLLQGDDAGKLNPAASATRMEVAVILMRFCGNVQD